MPTNAPLRAAGYCRTSGEDQRDNTSIPRQREAIEEFCRRMGWLLVHVYVDECRSGGKIAGRDDYQQMMKDAANGEFDVIVPFDTTRFGRDGVDIVESAKFLKTTFGVHVVDTKGNFDNRSHRNTVTNFVHAGLAEHERLSIMERVVGGRVRRAEEGRPWTSSRPIGRDYDPQTQQWYITDKGRAIAALLARYVAGESLTVLCPEYGICHRHKISRWCSNGQLAGTYVAHFKVPEIGLDKAVSVPAIPEVVSPELLAKAQARLKHNRRFNRHDCRKYLLTGFIRCADCGKALTGSRQSLTGHTQYRHNTRHRCSLYMVRGREVEPAVLDFLYSFFIDEVAFNEAVERALPSADGRDQLLKDRTRVAKRFDANERNIARLVEAVLQGVDASLLVAKQNALKAERESLASQLATVDEQLAAWPSVEQTQAAAALTRLRLAQEYASQDWRSLSFEAVQRFLFHLFGPQGDMSATGIFVRKNARGQIVAEFRGKVDFPGSVVGGRPVFHAFAQEIATLGAQVRTEYERQVAQADARLDAALGKPLAPNT